MLGRAARNKSAMSPIISSITLVSAVIVVAATSSNWLAALTGVYMVSEQVEVSVAYAEWDSALFVNGGWNMTVELKNSGSADTTADNILLNALSIKDYTSGNITLYVDGVQQKKLSSIDIPLLKGSLVRLLLQVERYKDGTGIAGCTANTKIDLKIHTTRGVDYPVALRLP